MIETWNLIGNMSAGVQDKSYHFNNTVAMYGWQAEQEQK